MRKSMLPPAQPPYVLRRRGDVDEWLRTSRPEERIVYYVGEQLPEEDEVAALLREAHAAGRVLLFRRRLKRLRSPDQARENASFEFVAVRCSRVTWRAM